MAPRAVAGHDRARGSVALWALALAALLGSSSGCFHHAILLIQEARGDSADAARRSTPNLCGNAICDDHRGERCTNCPADCGRCAKGKPELVAIAPESGPANRWVAVFGTHLDGVQKLWLVSDKPPGVLVKLRRKPPRLELFVPAGSPGGVLHVQAAGKRLPTALRYTVRPE